MKPEAIKIVNTLIERDELTKQEAEQHVSDILKDIENIDDAFEAEQHIVDELTLEPDIIYGFLLENF